MGDRQERGLESLQERVEETEAVVNATPTATRNKNKLKFLEEIRRMAMVATKCRNPLFVEEGSQDKSEECQRMI